MNITNRTYLVTTSQNAGSEVVGKANLFASKYGFAYVTRDSSLQEMSGHYNAEIAFFVFTSEEMYVWFQQQMIRFHINMAKLRIANLGKNQPDRMQQAMALRQGDRLLDCTMGMGTDAVVASYITGREGEVTALESELAIFHLVSEGLRTFELKGNQWLTESMRRITTHHQEALIHLQKADDKSYDIVYFDPMFRRPLTKSSGISGLRILSNPEPLSKEHIFEAIRVAKRAVVIKERPGSREFSRLGFSELPTTRGASVGYGIIYNN